MAMHQPVDLDGPTYLLDGAADHAGATDSDGPVAGVRAAPARRRAAAAAAAALSAAVVVAVAAVSPAARARLRSGFEGRLQDKGAYFGYAKFAPPFNDQMEDCGPLDVGYDYNLTVVRTVFDVGSASMCCAVCAAYPDCGAWTWGAAKHTDWLTQVCWLKAKPAGASLNKIPKDTVVSGLPSPSVTKGGVSPPTPSSSSKLDGVESKLASSGGEFGSRSEKCPGKLLIEGHGVVELINAGADIPGKPSGKVEAVLGDLVVPHVSGRTYFGKSCEEGDYDPTAYSAIKLLGKGFSWMTDISGTGCGCNAAFYLVSMPQNSEIGTCNDYYCDAMKVCGVPCAEVDLQEANEYSWMSTLHTYNEEKGADGLGVARGYGGSLGEPERRDFTAAEYGPGAMCIDTTRPFKVSVRFPVGADGLLEAMEITLSQDGQPCSLNARNDRYVKDGHRPMEELTRALEAGMTPVVSYWKSADMLWMDGLGADGRGPCVKDTPDWCADTVRFYDFSIQPL